MNNTHHTFTENLVSRMTKLFKYIRTQPLGVFEWDNLKKLFLRNSLYIIKGCYKIPSQLDMLYRLFMEERFLLIILDACRYDIFNTIYRKYLKGSIIKVRSPASQTQEWLKKVLPIMALSIRKKPIRIFSANPFINSKGIDKGIQVTNYIPSNLIIDVWDLGWDPKYNTVPPWKMNEIVKRYGLEDRTIIWYIQPHTPWLNFSHLFNSLIDISKRKNINYIYLLKLLGEKELLKRADFLRGYTFNLHIVLYFVRDLINYVLQQGFKGKIVLTSDHGEVFGEYGYWLHPGGVCLPELIIVPWLEIR